MISGTSPDSTSTWSKSCKRRLRFHHGVAGTALLALQDEADAGGFQRRAHRLSLVSDDGEDVVGSNDFVLPQPQRGPAAACRAISCSTLGRLDFSRVPLPAARMAMAKANLWICLADLGTEAGFVFLAFHDSIVRCEEQTSYELPAWSAVYPRRLACSFHHKRV